VKINPNEHISGHSGMTVRAEIAARMMSGLLANADPDIIELDEDEMAETAVRYADALVAELNK